MLSFLRSSRSRPPHWISVAIHANRIDVAQMEPGTQGRSLLRCESHRVAEDAVQVLANVRRQLGRGEYMCSSLLQPRGYQMQMTDAPAVQAAEMREAVRWKLRDLLDYPVDQATLDVLHVPPPGQDQGRIHHVFAVTARNTDVASRMRLFHEARFPLHAIDVPEMAQRNVAALFGQPGRGIAMLSMDTEGGLLTVTRDRDLFLARRTDIALPQLQEGPDESREQAFDRLVLELQRTFDHFDRQFSYVSVSRLLVTPLPALLGHLQANLDLPVEGFDLGEAVDLSAVPALSDPMRKCEYLHLIGAAMREEAQA